MKYNKGFGSLAVLLIIIAILAVGGIAYYSGKNSVPKIEQNNNQPQLSTTLPQYVGAQSGWPPVIQNSLTPYSCHTQAQTGDGPNGSTVEVKVGSSIYCRTIMSEGAAGSRYAEYTYVKANGSGTKTTNFTLRLPNCDNWDDPEKTQCKTNQNIFFANLDALIDSLM